MERSSQTELLKILPSLYNDLLLKKVGTLKAFQLDIRRINIKEPSELGLQIINDMCLSADEAIKLQCGREYGFPDGEEQRAAVLATEEPEKLVSLPTNNLITEIDFSKFDRVAKVAKSRNRKFTAKGIRDSMVLFKSDNVKVDRLTKKITKLLSHHEQKWTKEQKQKLEEQIQLKLAKGRKAKDYSKRLLQECKTWGGPFTSVSELQNSLKKHPDIEHRIVKTEVAYYTHSNKVEKIARPDFFRLNGISHDEKLENLALLLDEDDNSSVKFVVDLPTNEEVISKVYAKETKSNEISTHQINEICVIIWLNSKKQYEWFLGYIIEQNDEGYVVDHLHRTDSNLNSKWHYPSKEDKCIVEADQILPCQVQGQWDITDLRNTHFTLKNVKEIQEIFQKCSV